MWMKLLTELLPHAAPVARQIISSRTADPEARQTTEAIRHDMAAVTTSNKSLAHQMEEQVVELSRLRSDMDQMLPALQNTSARINDLQDQVLSLSVWLKVTLLFGVASTVTAFIAVILLMRHS